MIELKTIIKSVVIHNCDREYTVVGKNGGVHPYCLAQIEEITPEQILEKIVVSNNSVLEVAIVQILKEQSEKYVTKMVAEMEARAEQYERRQK